MLEEISRFLHLSVYTNEGVNLGTVENVLVDVTNDKIDGLYVAGTNPVLVEGSVSVNVPYRWVQAVGDIVILKYFPEKVVPKKVEEEEKEEEEEEK